jgi:HSP20 family protein
MKLVKRNHSIPTFFDDFFVKDFFETPTYSKHTVPAVNIHENENDFEVEVAAPGLKKEDFNVKLEKNYLIISAENKEEKEERKGKTTSREFSYKSFRRAFTVDSEKIDADNIKAIYENGILQLVLPKRTVVEASKTITIQ